MATLLETLAAELERPRELSARVQNYIGDTYGIDRDAIGSFLLEVLPTLEDHEIDLVLSPVFTPKLADQAVFAALLGSASVPREQWPSLIQQLIARPTRARLITSDGKEHSVPLRDVTIERYVHRLRLEATISESLFNLIDSIEPAADRGLLKAIARRPVWENVGTGDILVSYLSAAQRTGGSQIQDATDLLDLVENRKPSNLIDLLANLPRWQEMLRQQIDVSSGPKPFFSKDAEAMHGGGRDRRRHEDVRILAKQRELDFLLKLEQILS